MRRSSIGIRMQALKRVPFWVSWMTAEFGDRLHAGHFVSTRKEYAMVAVVNGTIRGIAKRYVDGTEVMEIWVPSDRARGLPYTNGIRIRINLTINGQQYEAGMRATANNSYVWICPNVKTMNDKPKKLAHVLASAGFKKNDKVFLVTDGNTIEVKAASSP